mgnify:CR=1 FL=1
MTTAATQIDTITLVKKYQLVRNHSEQICEPLATEDYVVQPIVDVSPPKWHIAHTTWFFEQFILTQHVPDYKVFHPDFSFLFNSYYEAVGKRTLRHHRQAFSRRGGGAGWGLWGWTLGHGGRTI